MVLPRHFIILVIIFSAVIVGSFSFLTDLSSNYNVQTSNTYNNAYNTINNSIDTSYSLSKRIQERVTKTDQVSFFTISGIVLEVLKLPFELLGTTITTVTVIFDVLPIPAWAWAVVVTIIIITLSFLIIGAIIRKDV